MQHESSNNSTSCTVPTRSPRCIPPTLQARRPSGNTVLATAKGRPFKGGVRSGCQIRLSVGEGPCVARAGKTFEDCLSRPAIDSLADGGRKGLSGSRSLGSRLINRIPTQHFGPLSAPNYEAKRLYLYCAPCHLVLDLALSICGHMTYFNGVIRVDDRLCAPSEPRRAVFQGMSTLQRAGRKQIQA
jgi:hypothetical protein